MRKKLVSATFLPILDYGDVVYQHAPSYLLSSLDALYHGALRFITDCKFTTHWELYERVAWPPWEFGEKCTGTCWYIRQFWVICQIIYVVLYKELCLEIHSLRSQSNYNLCVSFVRTELGKTSFKYAAASDWTFSKRRWSTNLVSYNYFKSLRCVIVFNWLYVGL